MSKEIDNIVRKQVERDLEKFYAMSEADKDAYMDKLLQDIEAGKQASAEIHTEALIKRCRGLND